MEKTNFVLSGIRYSIKLIPASELNERQTRAAYRAGAITQNIADIPTLIIERSKGTLLRSDEERIKQEAIESFSKFPRRIVEKYTGAIFPL